MKTLLLRMIAASIDGIVGGVLCYLLSTSVGVLLSTRAAAALEIGSPDTFWSGPVPMMLSIHGSFFFGLPLAAFLVGLNEPVTGVAVGKIPLRLRVVSTDGGQPSTRALWSRTLVKMAGPGSMTLALLSGQWQLVILALAIGAVTFLGFFLALGPSGRGLHDRVAGTMGVTSRKLGPSAGLTMNHH